MTVAPADMHCLCVNAGSSSLKLALYRVDAGAEQRLGAGSALAIGQPEAAVEMHGEMTPQALPDHLAALDALFSRMTLFRIDAVGHRVVHGGEHFAPAQVVPALLRQLEDITSLAPLHNPPALLGIRALGSRLPGVPQVACFDTAFHRTLPETARTLPLAHRFRQQGIRRYGFHGLSYEYIVRRLKDRARGRVVIAHLGNGASLAALLDGRSVDTTMGMTPIGGVMMGTRSGDLDPGILLHLLRARNMSIDDVERAVEREAGLLGVSGTTADMASLLKRTDPDARLAVQMFAYQVRKAIGALTAALGGLDRLVFTGGIGEHAAPVRSAVCAGLGYLGIELDEAANEANAEIISISRTQRPVHVIPTDEDAMIARHVYEVLLATHVRRN